MNPLLVFTWIVFTILIHTLQGSHINQSFLITFIKIDRPFFYQKRHNLFYLFNIHIGKFICEVILFSAGKCITEVFTIKYFIRFTNKIILFGLWKRLEQSLELFVELYESISLLLCIFCITSTFSFCFDCFTLEVMVLTRNRFCLSRNHL